MNLIMTTAVKNFNKKIIIKKSKQINSYVLNKCVLD